MTQSKIALALTVVMFALSVFSMWFFPFNGVTLAGLILGTGFIVTGMLMGTIAHLLQKEGN